MNNDGYNVRAHRQLTIVPLPLPRRAFRVWHGGDDIGIEEGEVIALAHDTLGYTWDGTVDDTTEEHGGRRYRNLGLAPGDVEHIKFDFRWIGYLFVGFTGEVDNEPLNETDLYWDKASAEKHVTELLEIQLRKKAKALPSEDA
jgi:hypothetical protein